MLNKHYLVLKKISDAPDKINTISNSFLRPNGKWKIPPSECREIINLYSDSGYIKKHSHSDDPVCSLTVLGYSILSDEEFKRHELRYLKWGQCVATIISILSLIVSCYK